MVLSSVKWFLIAIYTCMLGLPAIMLSFVFPGSDIVPLFGKLWTFLILKTAGVKVIVSGKENIRKKNVCIYLSNHQSYFDVFALVNILPARVRIIAKKYLYAIPVFGWSIRVAGYISLDTNRRDDLMKSFEEAGKKIKKGRPVLFFAEGVRSSDGTLQEFKKGAFLIALKAGIPIVPITISGAHEIMPPGTMRIKPGTMKIIFDEPILTEDLAVSQLNELMTKVRTGMMNNLKEMQNENR